MLLSKYHYGFLTNTNLLTIGRHYTAEEEEGKIIAQASEPLNEENRFVNSGRIKAREGADFPVRH